MIITGIKTDQARWKKIFWKLSKKRKKSMPQMSEISGLEYPGDVKQSFVSKSIWKGELS